MTKKKKNPNEMTDDELARYVFPKKVVEKAKEIANPETKLKPQTRPSKSS